MNPKIASVAAFPISYPTRGFFKFLLGPGGRPAGRAAVVVKITADNGEVGWGQSVPSHRWSYETLETVLSTIRGYLAPELVGLEVCDEAGVSAAMKRIIASSFSTGQPIGKAGVDLALFDLAGRLLGQSAAQRWQRSTARPVTLSWTLNPRSLAELETMLGEGLAEGYQHFNVKVAPDPQFDLEVCRRIRQVVPQGFLWADANGGYDVTTALEVAPRLADLGVPVLEQPLPPNCLSGYQSLKRQGAIPIIMDEGIISTVELESFLHFGLLDGVAMKVARCGGIHECRRIIEMTLDRGLMFLGSGLTDPDLSLAASLALYSAYDLKYPAALNGPQYLEGTILKTPFVVRDGQLAVPGGAGLGCEVDEGRLEAMAVRPNWE